MIPEKIADKYDRNAELISILSRNFSLETVFPFPDHPTQIQFWSYIGDPRRHRKFNTLLKQYHKICIVESQQDRLFLITIDNDDND
jgi:hypothetical protein